MERCRQEITAIEAELLAGNPDIHGLCLALSDWWAELRILEAANVATSTSDYTNWRRVPANYVNPVARK